MEKQSQLRIATCTWDFALSAPKLSFLDQQNPPEFEPANATFKVLHVGQELTPDIQRELRDRLIAKMSDGSR